MSALVRAGQFLVRPRNLGVLTACLAATAMVVATVTPVWDPDVWWVAAAGREMLRHRLVPHENAFSYVEPHHAWIMHEWLFGPPYAWLLGRFGPAAFDAVAGCSLACALALLAATTVGRARHLPVGIGSMAAAVALFGGRFLSARPTGVALLFPLAMVLLAFGRRFTARSAALALLVELVWANAHGSFPLGVALLLVAAFDADRDRALRLATAGLAAAVTLVTPYGAGLHRFVWDYFQGSEGVYRAIHAEIREFGTLWEAWGATVGPVDVLGLAACAVLAASAARDPRRRLRGVFCLALVAMAILHARHVELAGLMACTLLIPHSDDLAERVTISVPAREATWPRARVAALLVAPACVGGLIAFVTEHGRRSPEEWIATGPPFLRVLASVPDGSNVFVPFALAGQAIWYGSPRGVRVFADSRNDCYSADTFREFFGLDAPATPAPKRSAMLDATGTDAAVLPAADPLASQLASEPGWVVAGSAPGWLAVRRDR